MSINLRIVHNGKQPPMDGACMDCGHVDYERRCEALRADLAAMTRERDAARAAVRAGNANMERLEVDLYLRLQDLEDERDQLAAQVAEMTAERDAALRNVLALARRMRKTDPVNAATLARFCAEAGVVPSALREAAR